MSISKILHHWVLSPIPVKYSFPLRVLNSIEKQIESCETQASVEFRVIVERSLPMSYLRRDLGTKERARTLFGKYEVWDTEDNNGVLIYLNLTAHAIELVLDRNAMRAVSQDQINGIVEEMEVSFANKDFEGGVCRALEKLTELLKIKFPNKPVSDPLPNSPILL